MISGSMGRKMNLAEQLGSGWRRVTLWWTIGVWLMVGFIVSFGAPLPARWSGCLI